MRSNPRRKLDFPSRRWCGIVNLIYSLSQFYNLCFLERLWKFQTETPPVRGQNSKYQVRKFRRLLPAMTSFERDVVSKSLAEGYIHHLRSFSSHLVLRRIPCINTLGVCEFRLAVPVPAFRKIEASYSKPSFGKFTPPIHFLAGSK